MRCQERQMTKLVDIIKSALNEVGCEELPSGCDDLSVEQTFIETNGNSEQPVSRLIVFFVKISEEMVAGIKRFWCWDTLLIYTGIVAHLILFPPKRR
jgi:hypothetical protein